MPDKNDKVKENIAGTYYVDTSCIDCDVCRDTAPENFKRSDAKTAMFAAILRPRISNVQTQTVIHSSTSNRKLKKKRRPVKKR